MKQTFLIAIAAMVFTVSVLTVLFGCTSLKTGTETFYEGAAMGYRGLIRVQVGIDRGTITEITVVESSEDKAVGTAAMEELADLVLMYNTTELDAISGATETSKGFLAAVENAIIVP